jgi:hypothetical protein
MNDNETPVTTTKGQSEEVVTDKKTATKTIRLNVADIEWLEGEGIDEEKPAATLSRLREELQNLRAERIVTDAKIAALLEQLPKSPTTEIVSSNANLSDFSGAALRDTMETVKDTCEDDVTCVKTALHMLDTKAKMVGDQLDRDHADEQKRLDRDAAAKVHGDEMELKNKDLELKEKRLKHEKEMILIKKGVVPEGLLDGMVFLGEHKPKKTAHQILAERQKRAYQTANADGDDEWMKGEDDLADVDA